MEIQPYFLTELEDLSSIFVPLKTTSRIKYTCFNASKNFLIFGATSGGLYVFQREPCCFLQLLPNKEGAVTQVSISPNEKLIAFSTIRGIICILEKTSHGAKQLVMTAEHQNEQITSLQWNCTNSELFVGDNSGKVSIVMVSIFPTKGMFQTPSFVLMQLDSKIVQMDFSSNMLLVSTLTKCYICDTKKEVFRQVGHKLRDGEYGACIINTRRENDDSSADGEKSSSEGANLGCLKLFCARPGSRVWECAIDGTVISTHHFKEALAVPPKKIYFLNDSPGRNGDSDDGLITNGSSIEGEQINSNFAEQSFNFQKLHVFMSKFFFTFKSDGIYIFDPEKAVVVLWNNEIKNIVDAKSANDVIYIWSGYGKMYALNLIPLEKFLLRLYVKKKYSALAELCLEHESYLLAKANDDGKLHLLQDLEEKLKSDRDSIKLRESLKTLISIYEEKARGKRNGIARKSKKPDRYFSQRNCQVRPEERRWTNQNASPPATYLNLKGRSHSVSPERLQNGNCGHLGGSSSLPDLMKEENGESESNLEIGKRMEETNAEVILKICDAIENSRGFESKELIFDFFERISSLEPEFDDSDKIRSFPFENHFGQNESKSISNSFHSILKGDLFFDWLSNKFDGNRPGKWIENYPEILMANHTAESLERDFKLSKLIKFFSNLLNENEIVEIIRGKRMDCYYFSLMEILNFYRENSLSSISDDTLNLSNVSSSPKILNIVYFLIGVGQIERCAKYSGKIDSTEFFYLMLEFEEESKKTGKPAEIVQLQCRTIFLAYLEKTGKTIDGLTEIVENYSIDSLEIVNSTADKANCPCGFPGFLPRPSAAIFPEIGYALIEKTWPKNKSKSMEICGRIPFFWKYLIYARRNESLDSVLPMILQSGEIEELEIRSKEIDSKLIESCIVRLIKLKRGECLNCGGKMKAEPETISWTEFGLLSIKLTGPVETLEIFNKYSGEIDSGELNGIFFQALIFSSVMEKRSKGLSKNVVNFLAGKTESETNRIPAISETVKNRILTGSNVSRMENLKKFPKFSDFPADFHHWGVKVDFRDNCPICSLPLDTKLLISETGLIVFKCAHAFHSACLPKVNLECFVCRKKEK